MRNVLVTGGTRGVGLAIAKKLAADGFRIFALGRRESPDLEAAIAEMPSGVMNFVPFDLAQIDLIAELVREMKAEHGPLYGLINNAALGTDGLLSNMHNSDIERLVRLNTVAPIVLTKYAVRSMMTSGSGRIVNISSIIGSTGYSGLSVYGATKASMLGFTRSLAREVGRLGVTVNAVAPGFMDTEMTAGLKEEGRVKIAARSALKRLAEVEDVAGAVSYLMSDAARNVTGTTITVDAGNTA
ncbi:MAG: 3-oxoacyl-ACP reductase [Alphaproteobacteria bacterium 64-11]|nr:SDR family oxidoreductase [Alphaproteobacteria bacterium]OJU13218.1 MAG: 3-oxoacyl-ACP reductase [Alphaproteobacteria bacterium 64-11]